MLSDAWLRVLCISTWVWELMVLLQSSPLVLNMLVWGAYCWVAACLSSSCDEKQVGVAGQVADSPGVWLCCLCNSLSHSLMHSLENSAYMCLDSSNSPKVCTSGILALLKFFSHSLYTTRELLGCNLQVRYLPVSRSWQQEASAISCGISAVTKLSHAGQEASLSS